VAIPKAHGFEDIAQHPRVRLQPDLALSILDTMGSQQGLDPRQRIILAFTMVSIMEAQGSATVASKQSLGLSGQLPHG
jgi:hypothetical protein